MYTNAAIAATSQVVPKKYYAHPVNLLITKALTQESLN